MHSVGTQQLGALQSLPQSADRLRATALGAESIAASESTCSVSVRDVPLHCVCAHSDERIVIYPNWNGGIDYALN